MINDSEFHFKKTLSFISVWNWHIVAVICLVGSFILFEFNMVTAVVIFAMFVVAEYIALRRRNDFYEDE